MTFSNEQLDNRTANAKQNLWVRVLPLALTCIAGLLCYGLFYNRSAWLSVIGYSVSPAERVLQGEVPYRDFLYNYTPGILWLNAFLMRAFGVNLLTIHLGLLVFKLATLIVLYFAAKKLLGSWAALAPVALSLSWIGYKYIFGVFPTQYSMLFVLLGILFMLKADESERWFYWLLSGLAVGAVFLFKYNVGILLFGCGGLAILIREWTIAEKAFRQFAVAALKKACVYGLGFTIALLPLAIYLIRNQALRAMFDHFIHHASAYGNERAVSLPRLKSLAPTVAGLLVVIIGAVFIIRKAQRFFFAYLFTIFSLAAMALLIPGRAFMIKNSAIAFMAYLPIILFASIAIVLFFQFRRHRQSTISNRQSGWWQHNGKLIIVALFALGAYMEMYPRADYYHLVRSLPPTFLLIAFICAKLFPLLRHHFAKYLPSPERTVFACCAVAMALLMLVGFVNTWQPNFDSHFRFIDRESLTIERGKGILVPPKQAEFIKELTDLITNNSSPDDYVFSFGQRGAGFYFLSGRRNPTKFVWWRNVGIKKEDRDAVLLMIGEKRSKLILLQDSLKDARVRDAVNVNYHKIGAASGIGVYDRNE
jgi:4-amino-4-deoxy-L-arabinose transferase-like glycosyltransferase